MILVVLDTSPLHSSEPGDKVLLTTWKTRSPESLLEEKWTGTMWKKLSFHVLLVFVCPWKDNWGPRVILKDTEMFSLKHNNVALAGKCATFVNCTKKGFR